MQAKRSGRWVRGGLLMLGILSLMGGQACRRRGGGGEPPTGPPGGEGVSTYYITVVMSRNLALQSALPESLIYVEVRVQQGDSGGRYVGGLNVRINGDTVPAGTLGTYIVYSGFYPYQPSSSIRLQVAKDTVNLMDVAVSTPSISTLRFVEPEAGAPVYAGESLRVVWEGVGTPDQEATRLYYVVELGVQPGVLWDTTVPFVQSPDTLWIPPDGVGFPGDQAALYVERNDTIRLVGDRIAEGSYVLLTFGDRRAFTVQSAPTPNDTLVITPSPSPLRPTIDWTVAKKALFLEVRRCVNPADSCRNNYTFAWAVDANWDSTGFNRVPFDPPVVYGEVDTTRYYERERAEDSLSQGILYYFRVDFEDGTYGAAYYTP